MMAVIELDAGNKLDAGIKPVSADALAECVFSRNCGSLADEIRGKVNYKAPETGKDAGAQNLPSLVLEDKRAEFPGIRPVFELNNLTFSDAYKWTKNQIDTVDSDSLSLISFLGRYKLAVLEIDTPGLARANLASNFAGTLAGLALYKDYQGFKNSKSTGEAAYYAAAMAGDLATAGGAIVSNIPSLRTFGATTAALGILYRSALAAGSYVYDWAVSK